MSEEAVNKRIILASGSRYELIPGSSGGGYKEAKVKCMKCDKCRDGYLIVKKGKGKLDTFLGCTNYKSDKSGCDNFMTKEYYLKYFMHE